MTRRHIGVSGTLPPAIVRPYGTIATDANAAATIRTANTQRPVAGATRCRFRLCRIRRHGQSLGSGAHLVGAPLATALSPYLRGAGRRLADTWARLNVA